MRRGVGLRLVAASGTILLGHALCSCGPTATACEENATCPPSGGGAGMDGGGAGGAAGIDGGGAGGTDGGGGAGGTSEGGADASADSDAPVCNTSNSPSEASCLVDDAYGVFVSAAASDAGVANGTRGKPFLTIAEGLAEAKKGKLRVYACGTFATPVTIDTALDGVRLYGGFDCGSWTYAAANRTVVKPAAAGVALKVTGVKALEISDFEFDALDAATAGESSITAIVDASDGVTLTRVKLVAGKGADGAAGTDGKKGDDGDAATGPQQGFPATCTSGGTSQPGGTWANPTACGSFGGPGGAGNKSTFGSPGVAGTPVENVVSANNNGGPAGANGTAGSPGNAGTFGAAAAASLAFTASGYTLPGLAANGTDGFPGQGGGGGGASNATGSCIGASGGAGGMGGCGGKLGTGGGSGGASVALLSWQSGVTLTGCTLISAAGGVGGKGGNGGAGGSGKNGAVGGAAYTVDGGTSIAKGGNGGPGGDGGPGGAGAGGHGGPSFALVCAGTSATQNSTTLQPGSGGAKGSGGSVPTAAGDGQTGLSAAEYKLP